MEKFGYNCAWFAVKSTNPTDVATALGISELQSCIWDEGVSVAYKQFNARILITPPINGWILCAGIDLFSLVQVESLDLLIELITTASEKLQTDVQFFATMRIVEGHVWMRAQSGKLLRAYAYIGESGETLCNIGSPTSEEDTLGLIFDDESDSSDDEFNFPREDDVLQIAGEWSINPADLTDIPVGTPFLGRFICQSSPKTASRKPIKQDEQSKDFTNNQSTTPKKWWKLW